MLLGLWLNALLRVPSPSSAAVRAFFCVWVCGYVIGHVLQCFVVPVAVCIQCVAACV